MLLSAVTARLGYCVAYINHTSLMRSALDALSFFLILLSGVLGPRPPSPPLL